MKRKIIARYVNQLASVPWICKNPNQLLTLGETYTVEDQWAIGNVSLIKLLDHEGYFNKEAFEIIPR